MYLICTKLQDNTCLKSQSHPESLKKFLYQHPTQIYTHKNQGISNMTVKMNHVLRLSVQI